MSGDETIRSYNLLFTMKASLRRSTSRDSTREKRAVRVRGLDAQKLARSNIRSWRRPHPTTDSCGRREERIPSYQLKTRKCMGRRDGNSERGFGRPNLDLTWARATPRSTFECPKTPFESGTSVVSKPTYFFEYFHSHCQVRLGRCDQSGRVRSVIRHGHQLPR